MFKRFYKRNFSSTVEFASFRLFNLPSKVLVNLVENRITIPTEIQSKSFEHLARGQSAVLLSETGSGKTLSFLLPSIKRIVDTDRDPNDRSPHTLIISPNPQLAEQTANMAKNICKNVGNVQTHLLAKTDQSKICIPPNTDLLITTMPVLNSLHHMKDVLFKNTKTVIIDEADWIMGEAYPKQKHSPVDIVNDLKHLRIAGKEKKQFIFACATLPPGVKSTRMLINKMFTGIPIIFSSKSHQTVSSLKQQWVEFDETDPSTLLEAKERELLNIIKDEKKGNRILVFANTIETIDFVYESLKSFVNSNANTAASFRVEKVHRKVTHEERQRILPLFLKGLDANNTEPLSQILVAGDVVARGYDFQSVAKVVQFDFATNVVSYLHRAGRTARAGNTGEIINFIAPYNERLANLIKEESETLSLSTTMEEVDQTKFAHCFSRNKSLRTRERRRKIRKEAVEIN